MDEIALSTLCNVMMEIGESTKQQNRYWST